MYSDTEGHVHIKSADPKEKPEIIFNYLATEQDRREWVEAVRVSRALLDTPAMREFTNGNIYAPVMMLAEKAADLIKGNRPLDPINVPFYQAGKNMPLYAEGETVSPSPTLGDRTC